MSQSEIMFTVINDVNFNEILSEIKSLYELQFTYE